MSNKQALPALAVNPAPWLMIITAIFVTCLVIANIVAVKIVTVFGLMLPASIIIFPFLYLLGAILSEVYGFKQTKTVIWLGFLCNLIAVLVIWLGQILPAASFWDGQAAYARILGYAPRILVASFIAYLLGELSNAYLLVKLKAASDGRWMWARLIAATFVGQGLDSVLFSTLAFVGTMPAGNLASMIITYWLVRSLYIIIATPLTYPVVNFLKQKEGLSPDDVSISTPSLIGELVTK